NRRSTFFTVPRSEHTTPLDRADRKNKRGCGRLICGSHCRGMPLTATGVGGPQWRTKRTINHHVAVVLDHKESSGSPSARPPHWTSGVIDHEVAVSLHHSETGIRALSSTVPERIPPLIQDQVSVNLVNEPEPSIGGLAKLAGQQEITRIRRVRRLRDR